NVVLYFSASWCPPCRTFTPKLITFANDHVGNEDFVVILVGSDRTKSAHLTYFKKFGSNFYAVPYDKTTLRRVQRAYAGGGIPNLVILSEDGKVVKGSYETNGKYTPKNRTSYIGPNSVLDKLREMNPKTPVG
ncbi:MAG: redoxin family protein, partial [Phycisphaerales bacterium]|nr:redoxin family protein [Phycisphaerales bacterium]